MLKHLIKYKYNNKTKGIIKSGIFYFLINDN